MSKVAPDGGTMELKDAADDGSQPRTVQVAPAPSALTPDTLAAHEAAAANDNTTPSDQAAGAALVPKGSATLSQLSVIYPDGELSFALVCLSPSSIQKHILKGPSIPTSEIPRNTDTTQHYFLHRPAPPGAARHRPAQDRRTSDLSTKSIKDQIKDEHSQISELSIEDVFRFRRHKSGL